MLKKILVLVLSLSFLVLSVNLVSAANTLKVSDSMSRQKVSVVSTHSLAITLSASNTFAAAETVVIDFKNIGGGSTAWGVPANDTTWTTADFTLSDGVRSSTNPVAVGAAPSCSAGANNYTVTSLMSSSELTLTACSGFTATAAGATLTFTIAAGGTNRQITNPSAATSATAAYEIWVTPAGDAQAEAEVPILTDDQVSVSASVDTYISFTATTTSGSDMAINLGELRFSSVTTSNATRGTADGLTDLAADNISLVLDTNAYYGTVVQVSSANGGLKSTVAGNYTLTSATETLAVNQNTVSATAGYGLQAQSSSPTQGTLTNQSPYNSSGNAVGLVDGTFRTMYQTANLTGDTSNPIVGGSMTVYVLAVPAKDTPAADDYSDTLTFRATSTF